MMPTGDFQTKVLKAWVEKRMGYGGHLSLSGDNVRILWDKEESTFSVSGSCY